MKYIIVTLISICSCFSTFAQAQKYLEMARIDSISIKRAYLLSQQILGHDLNSDSIFVFSIKDNIILGRKRGSSCIIYHFKETFNFGLQIKEYFLQKTPKIDYNKNCKAIFESKNKCNSFIYSQSDPTIQYKAHWDSEYLYFMVSLNGKKCKEFNLPISYTSKMKRKTFPMKQRTLDYLLYLLYFRK